MAGDWTSTALAALLTLPNVQFWQAENSRRLDRSHSGRHCSDTPYLVDAANIRTVNPSTRGPAIVGR